MFFGPLPAPPLSARAKDWPRRAAVGCGRSLAISLRWRSVPGQKHGQDVSRSVVAASAPVARAPDGQQNWRSAAGAMAHDNGAEVLRPHPATRLVP